MSVLSDFIALLLLKLSGGNSPVVRAGLLELEHLDFPVESAIIASDYFSSSIRSILH